VSVSPSVAACRAHDETMQATTAEVERRRIIRLLGVTPLPPTGWSEANAVQPALTQSRPLTDIHGVSCGETVFVELTPTSYPWAVPTRVAA
jgi:hypothetical protein